MRVASVMDLPPHARPAAERALAEQMGKVSPQVGELVRALTAPQAAKPRKFRNVPVVIDGEKYDSKLEYLHCEWIRRRQAQGLVWFFLRQVPFVLEGGVRYRCDTFVILTPRGINESTHGLPVEVWDAKGKDTQGSINKRKQVRARYGVEVQLWKKGDATP